MSTKTKIEWTEVSWNPIVGCTKVSEGCRNCYAIRSANRMNGNIAAYQGLTKIVNVKPEWTGAVRFIEERLLQPLKWQRPRMIFVNSMSDLFHEAVSDAQLENIFAVMCVAQKHTFQVLTKRPERMKSFLCQPHISSSIRFKIEEGMGYKIDYFEKSWPPSNVWLGVSVEDQKTSDERIPLLLQTPAAIRWISAEPLLGSIDISRFIGTRNDGIKNDVYECQSCGHIADGAFFTLSNGIDYDVICPNCHGNEEEVGEKTVGNLHWVVTGGESGPHARPSHPDWFRSLCDQCLAASVPFFFKQWGEWGTVQQLAVYKNSQLATVDPSTGNFYLRDKAHNLSMPVDTFNTMLRAGRKAAGRLLDGREWNQYPATNRG